ncbi:MAG: IclR family transcriptional regulator [Caldilineaceae bacterium]|nr:IclR family transcriptional regulator [Caldilineaceae bacterium]
MSAKSASDAVPAVDRAVEILQAMARARQPLMLSELSQLTATSRSTTFNTLATLHKHGLVSKDERHKTYSLGIGLFELGIAYIEQVSLIPAFVENAQRLVDHCGETVKLAVRQERDVVYLSAVEGPHSVRLVALVGTRRPAHLTAVGKVLLSELDDGELDDMYADYTFYPHTPNAINNLTELKSELTEIALVGHGYDREESSLGVNCVAAAVRDYSGQVIAAMSVGVPNDRLTRARMDELTGLIRSYALDLSLTLGWRGPG